MDEPSEWHLTACLAIACELVAIWIKKGNEGAREFLGRDFGAFCRRCPHARVCVQLQACADADVRAHAIAHARAMLALTRTRGGA